MMVLRPAPGSVATLLLLVLTTGLVAACADDSSVDDSEAQLEEGYLVPLEAAGLSYTVDEVCHYERRTADEPWHLQVTMTVDAVPADVAAAIEGQVGVVRRDRQPMVVQQYAGEPNRGWDGSIDLASGERCSAW